MDGGNSVMNSVANLQFWTFNEIDEKDNPIRVDSIMMHSSKYWERHYANGGTSGLGSRGAWALWKARVLNTFVAELGIQSVIEFGCGDGYQLNLAKYPSYLGYDVSPTTVNRCRELFAHDPTKRFIEAYSGERAELALSIDVAYHLIEDDVYDTHMRDLFAAAERFVVVYTMVSNARDMEGHMRYRPLHGWDKRLVNEVDIGGCDFFVFKVHDKD